MVVRNPSRLAKLPEYQPLITPTERLVIAQAERPGLTQIVGNVPLNIGRSSCCNFDGLIDEVYLYEGVLDPSRIGRPPR